MRDKLKRLYLALGEMFFSQPDRRLTDHFWLHEFRVSRDHPKLASKIRFSEADVVKLYYVCTFLLEPIRARFGSKRVKILSGKRSQALNLAVKGSKASSHLMEDLEVAVDFWIPGVNMRDVWNWIQTDLDDRFAQAILYPGQNFIHISLRSPRHQGQAFEL